MLNNCYLYIYVILKINHLAYHYYQALQKKYQRKRAVCNDVHSREFQNSDNAGDICVRFTVDMYKKVSPMLPNGLNQSGSSTLALWKEKKKFNKDRKK